MVSLLKTKTGYRVLQLGLDRGRLTIPLGKISKAAAESIRAHVRQLENAAAGNTAVPLATVQWLDGVPAKLYDKLAVARLVWPRAARESHALGKFLDGYIARRTDLKERTLANLKQARNGLVEHFGAGRDIGTINAAEAGDWHRWLKSKLAQATVAMHVKKARQFFADAVDRRLIAENPFKNIKAGKQSNEARMEYITRETIQKVIDACPDAEWRLLFAMARFGGLRIPSEIRVMQWGHVGKDRFTVHSSKTEHHDGGDSRVVPLFPELSVYLNEVLFTETTDRVHVFARLRRRALVTQAEKIIERAQVPRWGKLWQNLRSSCETDLMERFPAHVVCAWMGHSEAVARKHYLQVTEEHFRAALGAADQPGQHRTSPERTNKKPPQTVGNAGVKYPQGGLDPTPKYPRSPRILLTALRRAQRKPRNGGAR